jgi:hypothetical protein
MFDKLKSKTVNVLKDAVDGNDGSLLDIIKRTFMFIGEVIQAINEANQNRRYRKEAEKKGD